jgi:hypothetical protein
MPTFEKVDMSFERCKAILIGSLYIPLLSAESADKQFRNPQSEI